MSYTLVNYKTKKQLREAVASGQPVRCFNPGLGPSLDRFSGTVHLEGPWGPEPHTWYGQATPENGVVTKVK